jgi:hypothetical protein
VRVSISAHCKLIRNIKGVTVDCVTDLRVAIMMTLARISGYVSSVATALAAAAIANAATGPVFAVYTHE